MAEQLLFAEEQFAAEKMTSLTYSLRCSLAVVVAVALLTV